MGLVGDNRALSLTPRLAIGLAIWTMIASSLNEGADLFEADRSLLLNSTLDAMSLVLRVIWRNAIIFAHNLPVVAIALWLGEYTITWHLVLFLPLTALVLPALILPVAVFARLTLWRRDLKSLLPSIIQVGFFLTPILWSPPKNGPMTIVFNLNPAAWFIELVKEAVLDDNFRTDLFIRCLVVVFVSLCFSEMFKQGFRNVRKLI
jgi:ABC-type polysaccharide/polyol phosphate export permease